MYRFTRTSEPPPEPGWEITIVYDFRGASLPALSQHFKVLRVNSTVPTQITDTGGRSLDQAIERILLTTAGNPESKRAHKLVVYLVPETPEVLDIMPWNSGLGRSFTVGHADTLKLVPLATFKYIHTIRRKP